MRHDIVALFRQLTYGVYVIGVADGEQRNAFTAAWLMQVSFDPLLVTLSINPAHSSYRILTGGKTFSVNVLRDDQIELARRFGTPGQGNRLATVPWSVKATGAPVLTEALAYLDCELAYTCPAGDHDLVLGRVVDGAILMPDATPLTYRATGDMDGSSLLYPETFT